MTVRAIGADSSLSWVSCPAMLGPHYCWDLPEACAQEMFLTWDAQTVADQLTAVTERRSDSHLLGFLRPLATKYQALAATTSGRLF